MDKTKKPPAVTETNNVEPFHEAYLRYNPPYLVAFSLPIKPMKVTVQEKNGTPQVKYQSKLVLTNGMYSLKLIADEDFGHPFGKDRLLLAWLFSQVVKSKSKFISYQSIKRLLLDLGLSYSKPNRDWLTGAINRISNCYLQYSVQTDTICATRNGHILTTIVGPLDPKRRRKEDLLKQGLSKEERKRYLPAQRKFDGCYFEVSEDLFENLMKAAVPFDIRVVNELGDNYGAIDLYLFWSWRNFRLNKKRDGGVEILIAELKRHMTGAKDIRKFCQQLKERTELVKAAITKYYGDDPGHFKMSVEKRILKITATKPLIEEKKKEQEVKTEAVHIVPPMPTETNLDEERKKILEYARKSLRSVQ